MRHLLKPTLLTVSFFLLVAFRQAAFAMPPQEKVADKIASLVSSFESHIAKVSGSSVYITIPGKGSLTEGALGRVVNRDGAVTGFVRISSVMEKYAVCDLLLKIGDITPGQSIVRGVRPAVRILWLEQKSEDNAAALALSSVRESVRARGSIDIPSMDTSLYFLEKFPGTPIYGIPRDELRKIAEATSADLIALSMVEPDKKDMTSVVMLLAPNGERLITIKQAWPRHENTKTKGSMKSAAVAHGSINIEEKKPGSYLTAAWNGKTATQKNLDSKVMNIRERVRWNRYQVNTRVLSAAWVELGIGGEMALAVLDHRSLRIMRPVDGTLATISEFPVAPGLIPVSVTTFDTDADGREEIFINAFRDGAQAAFVIENVSAKTKIIADSLPFYFSASSDGTLLAQAGAKIFTVTRTNKELEFIPAFTLQGGDVPIGINRFDIDGDGTGELVGISSKGQLLIFTQAGRLVWKGGGYSSTGRVVSPEELEPTGAQTISVPPKVLPVKDSQAGLTLAVAGSEYVTGGILKKATIKNGRIWFVTIKKGEFIVQDSITSKKGWISDLIPPSPKAQFGEADAIGYIIVYPGLVYDESEIILPAE